MTSSSVNLAITAPLSVTVALNPTSASVLVGATRQISASVGGTSNTAVTWSVNNLPGGDATVAAQSRR